MFCNIIRLIYLIHIDIVINLKIIRKMVSGQLDLISKRAFLAYEKDVMVDYPVRTDLCFLLLFILVLCWN